MAPSRCQSKTCRSEHSSGTHTRFEWMKHIVGNEQADALPKAAPTRISFSHEKSQSRQHLITAWTTEWRKQLRRPNAFLQANRFTPVLQPRERFRVRNLVYEYYNKRVLGYRRSDGPAHAVNRYNCVTTSLLPAVLMKSNIRPSKTKASEDLVHQTSSAPRRYISAFINFLCATDVFKKQHPLIPPEIPLV